MTPPSRDSGRAGRLGIHVVFSVILYRSMHFLACVMHELCTCRKASKGANDILPLPGLGMGILRTNI